MFQLLKLAKADSGKVQIIIEYDMVTKPGETCKIEHETETLDQAGVWIEKAMFRYGYEWLTAYILHKKMLSETSRSWKEDMTRLRSLDVCLQFLGRASVMRILELAHEIVRHKADLELILPNINNFSYQSSYWNYNKLIEWAHEVIYQRRPISQLG